MDSSEDGEQQQHQKKKGKKRLKVTMEYVTPSEGEMAPVVGYFPSGFDLFNKRNAANPPKVQIYRHRVRPNRMEVVVRPQRSNVEFVGTSYSGEAAAPQLCKYSLGILDKEAKTLKIVPIAANKIFRLEPKIKGEEDEEETVEALTRETIKERTRELTNLFGSKKSKKIAKRLFRMYQQEDDPEAQEYLKNEMQNVEINATALEPDTEIVHNIPPYDLTADVPDKAYVLDKIIPKSEWSLLTDLIEILNSKDNVPSSQQLEEMGYPSFVSKRIGKLQEIKGDEKKKFARILSYITHLVNFLKLSSRKHSLKSKIQAGTTAEYIPQVVFQRFVSLFVDPVSQGVSDEKRELLMGYVLVLTLFADKFRTQPHDIAKDLKMTHPSLRPFFKNLGCSFTTEDGKSCCVLEVPLKLPGVMVAQRRPPRRRR